MEENKKNKIPNVPNLRFPEYASNWLIKTIGEICICKDNERKPLNEAERFGMIGNIPYYGANNVQGYINNYLFDEELILLAEDGGRFDDFKNYPIAQLIYGKTWVNNHAHVIKPKNDNACFIYQQLVHKDIRKYINGTSRAKLNQGDLLRIPLSITSLKEEAKIAEFLSLIDERMMVQNKIIEKYESLIKQLNDNIFSRGDNSKISDFIQELSKRNKDGAVTNVLSVSNKNGFVKQSEQFEDKELASEDKTNYKIVQKGDFAFNPARINVGSIVLLKNQEIGIVSPMYICFKAKNIPSEILESYFSSSSFKKEMNKRLEGSVRMCLTIDGMKNICFHNPSKKEIDILSRLTKLKELVVISKRILDLYNSQKSYLLSNLFI